jgi:hypothetical protein
MDYCDRLSPYGQLQKNPREATLPAAPSVGKPWAGQDRGVCPLLHFTNANWELIHD